MVKGYLVPQLTDSYNAGVIMLLVFIGGFVALMEKSGGGVAFAKRVTSSGKQQMPSSNLSMVWWNRYIFLRLRHPFNCWPRFSSSFR